MSVEEPYTVLRWDGKVGRSLDWGCRRVGRFEMLKRCHVNKMWSS